MRKFLQNKLWRDKCVDFLKDQGSVIHWRKLNNDEFLEKLKEKLHEECLEVSAARSREEYVNEIADVLEVLDSLMDVLGINGPEIVDAKNAKRAERGGFLGRKFVEYALHLRGSQAEAYCLNNPDKYPEG